MDQIQNRNDMPVEEQEIDLVELARKLWLNRGLIIKVACGFMAFGLAVALLSAKVYTATCDFVPQTSSSTGSSRMSSLAALAGININQMQDVKTLSPYVYEKIMNSATFGKELMMTEIDYRKAGRPVSFYEYNTSKEFNKPSVGGYILKYTVGLPSLVLNALRGEKSEPDYVASAASEGATRIEMLTDKEYECLNVLRRSLALSIDDKNGYLTLSANMAEPLAAAQLAQATLALLQRYITEFKIEKVQSNLDFVQERYDEAKSHFEDVQARRAKFRDANQNTIRYSARTEQEKFDAEYSLAMNLYSELATQLEQAKISVKETTPILTVVNPVTVPYRKSKPNRPMIVIAFTFLGVIVGAGVVLFLPLLGEISGSDRWRRFVKELPAKSASTSGADAEK